jgi:hypothetical protein
MLQQSKADAMAEAKAVVNERLAKWVGKASLRFIISPSKLPQAYLA